MVVEVAEAVGGPRGGLDGPVGGFGRGVGDVGLEEAQDLGPPGFDGLGEPLEFGGVRVGAPGVKGLSGNCSGLSRRGSLSLA